MRLGTRGSALALAQATLVADAVGAEVVTITTTGDLARDKVDKAKWVDAIEAALVAGEVDVAVHSAKDVPAELADGMQLAVPFPREDPRDALVGAASLDELPAGARVGTASLRRRSQLLAFRDDLEVVDVRGNVDTRLRKLAGGEVDALVLAAAGLRRLGREGEIGALLDPALFVPAPGQGFLALEGPGPLPAVDERATALLDAERFVVHSLGATCHTPIGVHADGTSIRAYVGKADGSAWIRDEVTGPGAERLIVERLRSMGAEELLAG